MERKPKQFKEYYLTINKKYILLVGDFKPLLCTFVKSTTRGFNFMVEGEGRLYFKKHFYANNMKGKDLTGQSYHFLIPINLMELIKV